MQKKKKIHNTKQQPKTPSFCPIMQNKYIVHLFRVTQKKTFNVIFLEQFAVCFQTEKFKSLCSVQRTALINDKTEKSD